MHWNDTAIVLSIRKHGENSAIARIFARQHGVFAGVIRGIHSKANRGIVQPGNIVNAAWQARLAEHIGTFKCELLEANAAHLMQDAIKLSALTSLCALIESALPERHPYPRLYEAFHAFLNVLRQDDTLSRRSLGEGGWQEGYVKLELSLLAEAGFGLDLTCCAATGATDNLIYVSPKSGRAVSSEAGEPYKEKLLVLPNFLLPPPPMGGRLKGSKNDIRMSFFNLSGVGVNDHRKPNKYGSHSLIPNARELRRESTPAERHLWYHLRDHRLSGHGFRRQHPLSKHYIADFVCLNKRLVIELDGGQHAEQVEYDAERTTFLEREGYRVLRFWNNEIFENTDGILERILEALEGTSSRKPTPTPTLPPSGGGGSAAEILAGMQLTGYFLDHWLLSPHHRKLPAARERLVENIKLEKAVVNELQ